jgi:hypothetical protein
MIIHNPILTGSFTVNGTDVSSITSSAASLTSLNDYTASQNNRNGTYATTGSNTFAGIQTVNSNLVVTGSITAQTLVVQTITSSVDFVTGSTRFGSLAANTHVFTGSMSVSGSVAIGIPSPSAAFHTEVSSSTWTSKIFNGNTATNNAGLWIKAGVNSGNEILLAQKANGTDVFLIDAGGNIGIGTNSPNAILDVRQSVTNSMAISFMNTYGATSSTSQTVDIYSKLVGSGLTGQLGSLIRTGKEGDFSSGGARDAYLAFSTAQDDSLVERMRISSGGIITTPYQVSFKAYISGANPSITKGVANTIPYNNEQYDAQSNYNVSNYKFTAPVAGKYLFIVNFNVYGLDDNASLNLILVINSSSVRRLYLIQNLPTGNTGDINISGSDILNLAVGDTVEVKASSDGSGNCFLSAGLDWNTFSGQLLG